MLADAAILPFLNESLDEREYTPLVVVPSSIRVLDIGHWSTTTRKPAERVKSSGDECGRALEYEAFVSFFLCEEALRSGTCSPKDIRYCFSVTDATGEGWIGRAEVTPFLEDMVRGVP